MKKQEEINKLLLEFNQLKSLNKKLDFWRDKLGFEYYDSFEVLQDNQWLLPFFLKFDNPQDINDINDYYLDLFTQKHPDALLDFDHLKNEFENKLRGVKNKKELISREIEQIKSRFKTDNQCKEYDDYFLNQKEIDIREKEKA